MTAAQDRHYQECLANGCSPRLAEMFALASPPVLKTDATFQAKNGLLGGAQFSNGTREHYLGQARAAGVSTDGKFYEGRCARFPGDPEAWVSGPDDVRRVLESRGWGCTGDITVKAPEAAPPKDVAIADDLVEDFVEDRLAAQFGEDFDGVSGKAVEVARDDVMNTHTPHWAKSA